MNYLGFFRAVASFIFMAFILSACGGSTNSLTSSGIEGCFGPICNNDNDSLIAFCDEDDNDPENETRLARCPEDGSPIGQDPNPTPQPPSGQDPGPVALPGTPSSNDSDNDGVSDACDSEPQNPDISTFNESCDQDGDNLLDQRCIDYFNKPDGQAITQDDYDAAGNLCDNCIPEFNVQGNADDDLDGIGNDCEDNSVAEPLPVDPCELTPRTVNCIDYGIDDSNQLVFVHTYKNNMEGSGTLVDPYGHQKLNQLVSDPQVQRIILLGDNSMPANLTIENRPKLEIWGGYDCSVPAHENTFGCNESLIQLDPLAPREGFAFGWNQAGFFSAESEPLVNIRNSDVDISGINLLSFGRARTTVRVHNSHLILKRNYISSAPYLLAEGEGLNIVNLQFTNSLSISNSSSKNVHIEDNFIGTGNSLNNHLCNEGARAIMVGANAILFNDKSPNVIDSILEIKNNDIELGATGLYAYGIHINANIDQPLSSVNIEENSIITTCSRISSGISVSNMPVFIKSNRLKIGVKENVEALSTYAGGVVLIGSTITSQIHNNLIRVNELGSSRISTNTGVDLTDTSAEIYANTVAVSGSGSNGVSAIKFFKENNSPVFSSKIINNLLINPANSESPDGHDYVAILMEKENGILLEDAVSISEFKNNIIDQKFDLVADHYGVTYADINDFYSSHVVGNANPSESLKLEYENSMQGLDPETYDFSRDAPHIASNSGYVFRDLDQIGFNLFGPIFDIDGNPRSTESPSVGCYQY